MSPASIASSSQADSACSLVKDNNIKVISDLPGKGPFLVDGLVNVPITIKGNNNTPIIEYLVSKGKRDDEIIEAILKEIDKLKYAGFYIHGIYEGIEKVDMLDRLIKRLKETGREVITIKQVAKLTEGRDKWKFYKLQVHSIL